MEFLTNLEIHTKLLKSGDNIFSQQWAALQC